MKYLCAYAYDIPCYFDFVVEAESWDEAERLAIEAVDNGVFDNVTCEPQFQQADNHHAFVMCKRDDPRCLVKSHTMPAPLLKDGKLQ